MDNSSRKVPNIFEYLDILKYLMAYYQYRKSDAAGFSFERWADELGFQSRSYLRMAVIGKKKISNEFSERFCRYNHLSKREHSYFKTLRDYSQAPTQAEKKALGEELIILLRACSSRNTIPDSIEFLSKPLYPRLLVMLGYPDIVSTPEKLSEIFDIPLEETQYALKLLETLKLAEPTSMDGSIQWRSTQTNFDVPESLGSLSIMEFHKTSLLESISAFHKPKNLRRYRSLLVSLSEEELKDFLDLMDTFASDQLARFQARSYHGKRLFQVNLNIHPVANAENISIPSENKQFEAQAT